jgi:hypothetical protein
MVFYLQKFQQWKPSGVVHSSISKLPKGASESLKILQHGVLDHKSPINQTKSEQKPEYIQASA